MVPVRARAPLALPVCFVVLGIGIAGCPDDSMSKARAAAQSGDHEQAGERFLAIAKADPANLGAWDGAVQAFCTDQPSVGRCMGVLDLELDLLGNLERHGDALSDVLERRARARLERGLIDAALDDLTRAENAAPDRGSVFVARARAYLALGRRQDALTALEAARKRAPTDPEIDAVYRMVPEAPSTEAAVPEERFGGGR